ncbi:MAG: hypothetical protein H0X64_11790 [Gemmatimonadaceae bacterium]|nr:hypothetical protein [Gemmatimonadaceae bacterium]
MRTRMLWFCGSVTAVTMAGACAPAARPADGQAVAVITRSSAPRAVQLHVAGIDINCHGAADKVTITLDKWKVRGGPNDLIRFQMKGNPNAADYFQITWKRPDPYWPLDSTTYTVPSGGSSTARVRANAASGSYAYNINFYCQGAGNPPQVYTGVIDPDIIISGGTTKDTTQN